jgi:hypothetical protein
MTRTDRDHLRVLSICHYVLAGLCFFFGAFPLLYLIVGIALVTEAFGPPPQQPNQPFPLESFGWFMIGAAALMIAFYWALAAGLVSAGRCLGRRASRTFCLVVAGFACLLVPFGTVLGVFTIAVLLRPSVAAAFEPRRDEPAEFDTYHRE